MKILIIRHGETTSDRENRYGGDYDDHLTNVGVEQAKALAMKLKDCNIQIIFSSPLIRARETSLVLAQSTTSEVQIIDDLKERNAYGILTGMTKEEANHKYPESVIAVKDRLNTIEGAESYENLLKRVTRIFTEISEKPLDTIVIVSHGWVIRCIFRDILKQGELKDLGDCAFIELEKSGHDFIVARTDGVSFE